MPYLPPLQNELHHISSILKYTTITNALCLQQRAGMKQKKTKQKKTNQDLVLRSHEAVAMKYLSIKLSVEAHCTSMY